MQAEFGEAVGGSNRVIAYYEDEAQPPGAMLVDQGDALRVSMDELLGVNPLKEKASPKMAKLFKRLQKIEQHPQLISAPSSKWSTPSWPRAIGLRDSALGP